MVFSGSYKPSLGKARTTWEPSGPFHQAREEGQKRVPSPGGTGLEKPPSSRQQLEQCRRVGRRQAPGERRSAPAKTRRLRPSGPTLGDQGPPGRKQRPPAPGPAGPAQTRVPDLRGLGPWRLQPQRARVSRCRERLGPLSPWPPARV